MPRYFFHTYHDGRASFDLDGIEMKDLREARSQMIQTAAGIMKDDGHLGGTWAIEVLDRSGKIIYSATFSISQGQNEPELDFD